MAINEQNIQCPKCGESISIDDVLTRQIEEKIKKDLQAAQQVKEQELTHKSEELMRHAAKLAESIKNIDAIIADKVADQLKAEKLKIFNCATTYCCSSAAFLEASSMNAFLASSSCRIFSNSNACLSS